MLKEIKLDCVISECALEAKDYSYLNMNHRNIDAVTEMKKIFVSAGILSEGARFLLTHIPTDRKRSIHEELLAIAAERGLTVTYDGYFASI